MSKNKIYDCITFFDENLLTNSRFEILDKVVDYFVICESKFDHKGDKKKLNFSLHDKKFEKKIIYIIFDNLINFKNRWDIEKQQREKIFDGILNASQDDYIMYSDSDEIPNPKILENFNLKKKFGIFFQNFYVYKLNIFNKYETPWEGTRICKKKDLRSFFFLRKNILSKNIFKPFWKLNVEKNIETYLNGGWHFNNLYNAELISKKLKSFPHEEYSSEKYSNPDVIQKKINNLEDLFERNQKYEKIQIDNSFPNYILNNQEKFKDFIL